MEQSLIEFTQNITVHYPALSYVFFFISAALQILFPPYPGDTVLVIEGYLSSKGLFNTYLIAINAMAATFLSSLLLYHTSYKLGDRIFALSIVNRFFSKDKSRRLTEWFKKYGSIVILISKFVPGIGSLTMIAAGTFKVEPLKAYAAMGAATAVHNSFLVFLGKTTGDNMELIKYLFRRYNIAILSAISVYAVLYICIKLFQKNRQPGENF